MALADFHVAADETVFRWVNGHAAAWADPLMLVLSNRYVGVILGVAVVGAVLAWSFSAKEWHYRLPPLAFMLALPLAIGISDFVGARVVKSLFARERPCFALSGVRLIEEQSASPSLPSLHAANAMAFTAFAVLAAKRHRRRWALSGSALALAIGYSRVYLGVHWPSDVLAGFLWGGVCAALVALPARAVFARRAPSAARNAGG